jgi:hypothetical protein
MEKQWRDLLLHATIETDPQKMLWLTAELDLRKTQAEAVSERSGNF